MENVLICIACFICGFIYRGVVRSFNVWYRKNRLLLKSVKFMITDALHVYKTNCTPMFTSRRRLKKNGNSTADRRAKAAY